MKGRRRARAVARMALLAALMLSLGGFELLLPPLPFFPPGAKPGLGNIVVMFALLRFGPGGGLPLVLVKSGFAFLLRGIAAGFLSLCGGVLSLMVLLLLRLPKRGQVSYLLLGIVGALLHNTGQLIGCMLLLRDTAVLWYFPALLLFGIAAGALTGTVLRFSYPYLERLSLD